MLKSPMHQFHRLKLKSRKGFGLLEVLLACVIIITILGALVFIARNALLNTVYLQQRSQATFLAQEGIEQLRQIRDSNYIDQSSRTEWDTMLYDITTTPKPPLSFDEADTGKTDYFITYSPTQAFPRFRLGTNVASSTISIGGIVYTRKINFIKPTGLLSNPTINGSIIDSATIVAQNALKAEVVVSWGDNKSVLIEELITNSRQGF